MPIGNLENVYLYECSNDVGEEGKGVFWTFVDRKTSTAIKPRPNQCKVLVDALKSITGRRRLTLIYEPPGFGKTMVGLAAAMNMVSAHLYPRESGVLAGFRFGEKFEISENSYQNVVAILLVPLASIAMQAAADFSSRFLLVIPDASGKIAYMVDVHSIVGKKHFTCPLLSRQGVTVWASADFIPCGKMFREYVREKAHQNSILEQYLDMYLLLSDPYMIKIFRGDENSVKRMIKDVEDSIKNTPGDVLSRLMFIYSLMTRKFGVQISPAVVYNVGTNDKRLFDILLEELNGIETIQYSTTQGGTAVIALRRRLFDSNDASVCQYMRQFDAFFRDQGVKVLVTTYEEWNVLQAFGKMFRVPVLIIDEGDQFLERLYPYVEYSKKDYDRLNNIAVKYPFMSDVRNLLTFMKRQIKSSIDIREITRLMSNILGKVTAAEYTNDPELVEVAQKLRNDITALRVLADIVGANKVMVFIHDTMDATDTMTPNSFSELFILINRGAERNTMMTGTPYPDAIMKTVYGAENIDYIHYTEELPGMVLVPYDMNVGSYKYPGKLVKMLAKGLISEDDLLKMRMEDEPLAKISTYVTAYIKQLILARKIVESKDTLPKRVLGIISSNNFGEMLRRTVDPTSMLSRAVPITLATAADILGIDIHLVFGKVNLRIKPGGRIEDGGDVKEAFRQFRESKDAGFILITSKLNRGFDLYGGGAMVIDRAPVPSITGWRVKLFDLVDQMTHGGQLRLRDKYLEYAKYGTVIQYLGRMLREPDDIAVVMSPDVRILKILDDLSKGTDTLFLENGPGKIRVKVFIMKSPVIALDQLIPYSPELFNESRLDWLAVHYGISGRVARP